MLRWLMNYNEGWDALGIVMERKKNINGFRAESNAAREALRRETAARRWCLCASAQVNAKR